GVFHAGGNGPGHIQQCGVCGRFLFAAAQPNLDSLKLRGGCFGQATSYTQPLRGLANGHHAKGRLRTVQQHQRLTAQRRLASDDRLQTEIGNENCTERHGRAYLPSLLASAAGKNSVSGTSSFTCWSELS